VGIDILSQDERWMREALHAADEALNNDEVPVGAVLVRNNELIAVSGNSPISLKDPSAHAEILALRAAAQKLNNYRLPGTTLYVTLEPCMMCAGALLHARVERLVFGAYDPKTGVAGGCFDWLQDERHVHKINVRGGVLKKESGELLQDFFKSKRLKK
jgi:tRNA(adenine34) deaminase